MKGLLRRVETESDAVDRLEVDLRIGFKVFAEFGDEHIHASPQEIVVFAPDIEQDLLSLEDTVGMLAKEFQQIGFFLGQIEYLGADGEL